MAEGVRKDPKGRILRNGETYDSKTGRYRYSYNDATGKRRQLYSWTLTSRDPIPPGKNQRYGESLREKEQAAQAEIVNAIDSSGGNMSVLQLMTRYVELKSPEVRETTRKGYRTQLKFMESQPFGKRKIKTVNATEAEEWFMELHSKKHKGYSTLHVLRGILKPAFAMAKRNRWTVDNPFDFPMQAKRYGGSKTRDALSRADMRRFLDFVRTDKTYRRYFDGIYILFNTGLRISEFCGLTVDDLDFENHLIHVRRQAMRSHGTGKAVYYIETTKTGNGLRDVPMMPDVETCFRRVIAGRRRPDPEPVLWDEEHETSATGFLWIDRDGNVEVGQHWGAYLKRACQKFNRIYKDELPIITPHVCRHTFCSNCARNGMNPKTLQTIMGHASIEFTLDVYTHLEVEDVRDQFLVLVNNSSYNVYPLDREPDVTSFAGDDGEPEPEPDWDEEPDDDPED